MDPAPETVIELRDVDVPRAQVPVPVTVAIGVNWKIDRGSFWAVGAFAGTGKTDLLLTVAGLQPPLRGTHFIFGKPAGQMSEEEKVSSRLKVAMVFDSGRLFSHLTVAENVALPLAYHDDGQDSKIEERVKSALDLTELGAYAKSSPNHIPRSLHQRVALARALALVPEVLLVDNPLMGIDQRQARWWLDFLCAANQGKMGAPMTVAVATDDLRPWLDTAANFAVLRERRFETIGGRDQVKTATNKTVLELLTTA